MLARRIPRLRNSAGRGLLRPGHRRLLSSASSSSATANLGAAAAAVVGLGGALYLAFRGGDGKQTVSERATELLSRVVSGDDVEMSRAQLSARYDFKKRLGKGGFGDVWLCIDRTTKREVAVKVLSLEHLPRAMVEQEVLALRKCGRHPNVVELLEVVYVKPDADNPWGEVNLVMEVAAGELKRDLERRFAT